MLYGVILAGGKGERLWPESRASRPKQFSTLHGSKTFFEETLERITPLIPQNKILVSTEASLAPQISALLPDFPAANILAEPFRKNTAPAIGWAALEILARDPEGIMAVLPSDHFIAPTEAFCETLREGERRIEEDSKRLMTIGIRPAYPATGYGYMKVSTPLPASDSPEKNPAIPTFAVDSFHEKPDFATAETYLTSGGYFWNGGIFLWKAKRILELLQLYSPQLADGLEKIRQKTQSSVFSESAAEDYGRLEPISIDYAVMEKAPNVFLLEAPFAWRDIGSFQSLAEADADQADNAGNLALGIELAAVESTGNLIRWDLHSSPHSSSPNPCSQELIALAGVDDLVIVRSEGVTLITRKGKEGLIKKLTQTLRRQGKEELL